MKTTLGSNPISRAVGNLQGERIGNFVEDWLGPSDYSSAGKARIEAEKSHQRALELQSNEQIFNSAEAAKNRDWQEYMANTTYQRAVNDMRAAGINPILAYQVNGQTPSGAVATSGSASGAKASYTSNRSESVSRDTLTDFLHVIVSAAKLLITKKPSKK